jgi:hypothetical protein
MIFTQDEDKLMAKALKGIAAGDDKAITEIADSTEGKFFGELKHCHPTADRDDIANGIHDAWLDVVRDVGSGKISPNANPAEVAQILTIAAHRNVIDSVRAAARRSEHECLYPQPTSDEGDSDGKSFLDYVAEALEGTRIADGWKEIVSREIADEILEAFDETRQGLKGQQRRVADAMIDGFPDYLTNKEIAEIINERPAGGRSISEDEVKSARNALRKKLRGIIEDITGIKL